MVEPGLKMPFGPALQNAPLIDPTSPSNQGTLNFEKVNLQNYEEFVKKVAIPYFTDLFTDLAKRETEGDTLIKSSWQEYCSLTAMISERFWALMDPKGKGYTRKDTFIKVMTQIYLSDLESK